MRDGISSAQVVMLGVQTLSGTTPNASAWFDTKGLDSVTLDLLNGTITDAGTAAGFTGTMQESDLTTAVSATAVAAADCVGGVNTVTVTTDGANNIIGGKIGYVGNKRYVRINFVGTSGTNATLQVIGRGELPAKAPTTYIGASVAAT
jgi:hypothetical protein